MMYIATYYKGNVYNYAQTVGAWQVSYYSLKNSTVL